jgi:hypothetical protein
VTRWLTLVEHIINSARSSVDSFNATFEPFLATPDALTAADVAVGAKLFRTLDSEMDKSHVASLVPLTLFSAATIWRGLLLGRRVKDLTSTLVTLLEPLTLLLTSLGRAEKIKSFFPPDALSMHALDSSASKSSFSNNIEAKKVPSKEEASLSASSHAPVLQWDVGLSNNALEFSDQNTSCRRPGSTSCYPASFATLPGPQSVFNVVITEANSATNWLSIGLCYQLASSDGFGRTSKSWCASTDHFPVHQL